MKKIDNRGITVLGIGNRLMMDDGIGIYIVEELQKNHHTEGVTYSIGESDIEYSLDIVLNSKFTIIIDAIITNKTQGILTVIPFEELLSVNPGISPHNDHLLYTIAKSSEVKGVVIGIEINAAHITYHFGLSELLEGKFDLIMKDVKNIVDRFTTI